jgi:hypothetical protein
MFHKIGSRVVRCNGKVGVLFNPNKELMKSYHAENRLDPDAG